MFEKRNKEIPDDIDRVWFPTEEEYIVYKERYNEYRKNRVIPKQVREIILKWYNIAKDRMKVKTILRDFLCPHCGSSMIKRMMPTGRELFCCPNWNRGCLGYILSKERENKIKREGSFGYLDSLAGYSWQTELKKELENCGFKYDKKYFDKIISAFFQQEGLPTIRKIYDDLCKQIGQRVYEKSNNRSNIHEECLYNELKESDKYLDIYKGKVIFYTLKSYSKVIPKSYIKIDVLAIADSYVDIYECKQHDGFIDNIQKINYEKVVRKLYPNKGIFFKYDFANGIRSQQIEDTMER